MFNGIVPILISMLASSKRMCRWLVVQINNALMCLLFILNKRDLCLSWFRLYVFFGEKAKFWCIVSLTAILRLLQRETTLSGL